jgi:hypothetical protein
MYAVRKTHLLVIDKEGLEKVMKAQKDRIIGVKMAFLKNIIGF